MTANPQPEQPDSSVSEEQLQKLGDQIDPELAELINACIRAAKLVESDGASYRHMPDFFKARGALVMHLQSAHAAGLAAGRQEFGEELPMQICDALLAMKTDTLLAGTQFSEDSKEYGEAVGYNTAILDCIDAITALLKGEQ